MWYLPFPLKNATRRNQAFTQTYIHRSPTLVMGGRIGKLTSANCDFLLSSATSLTMISSPCRMPPRHKAEMGKLPRSPCGYTATRMRMVTGNSACHVADCDQSGHDCQRHVHSPNLFAGNVDNEICAVFDYQFKRLPAIPSSANSAVPISTWLICREWRSAPLASCDSHHETSSFQ